jgi:AcrR family transcriptional regulator
MQRANARKRRSRTSRRHAEILEAALACFTELGFAATTMADVCQRSRASVGSVYHHFKSKEQLAGALFLEGLRDYQQGLLDELGRVDTGRPGSGRRLIRTMVDHYLRWVEAHRVWARYLIEFGGGPFVAAFDDQLESLNREFLSRVEQAVLPAVKRGELRRLPRVVSLALVFGPVREFVRRWLWNPSEASLAAARRFLPDAAWRSMLCPKENED